MDKHMSRLQKLRQEYVPELPSILQNLHNVSFQKGNATSCISDEDRIKQQFPKTFGRPVVEGKPSDPRGAKEQKVGVVFSGGQASGGHNVISGIFDALIALCPQSKLIGFLGGPSGIIDNKSVELTRESIAPYRNQGGFDLIGSGRTKIETEEQLQKALQTANAHSLTGLVIIGGDDSNTNAAVLAEYFLKNGSNTSVIGVPKTIDGDLKNSYVATSFGFDTAAKTYSEMIGNIARDALSAKKYYHFIKLMGRSASHITLECALSTHPNLALIGEEIAAKKMTLAQITNELVELIEKRSRSGKDYGVILVPEGLIEFIPEVAGLIQELNKMAASGTLEVEQVISSLSAEGKACFSSMPEEIQKQLLLDRDPHGNVAVSQIETEKLLISAVKKELKKRNFSGKFSALSHFFGYEGRAGFPSNFDAHYCYALGYLTALLIDEKLTGYMAAIGNLHKPVLQWSIFGLPITMLLNMEVRKGKEKPVIQKALVDLKGSPFIFFAKCREEWAHEDHFRFPGPIQFFGETEVSSSVPMTLHLSQ